MAVTIDFEALFSSPADAGDDLYSKNVLIGEFKELSYRECQAIYRYWPLGKRVASALPNFAMSPGRTFNVDNGIPEIKIALERACEDLAIEDVVYQAAVYSRVYGLAFVFVAAEGIPLDEPVSAKYIQSGKPIKFNILDPLSKGANISFDNDPTSLTFGLPTSLTIKSQKVHSQRLLCSYNDIPLFLKWNPSTWSFSGPSIYQNMTLLIRSWNRCIIALRRLATKASSIVVKSKDSVITTGANLKVRQQSLEMIRSMENDGIADLKIGEEVEMFNLQGTAELDTILNKIHSALMMALSDTPSGILLDKNLAQSMSDGDNDMKAIIISVDKFRRSTLKPIYNFVDKFVCYKAFDKQLINTLKSEYADLYGRMSDGEIFNQLMSSYSFEFNDLYPQTENEQEDTKSKRLDNLVKIKDLGAELTGIEEALNSEKMFGDVDFSLIEENLMQREMLSDDSEESFESDEAPKTIDSPDEGAEH